MTKWGQWFATASVLFCGFAGAAGAAGADLSLDPGRFFLRYQIKDTKSPEYQVLPPLPFNNAATPFLLPCDTQNFGGQLRVISAGPDAVYPSFIIRFFSTTNNIITSHGFSGTQTIDHGTVELSLLPAGQGVNAGYTPISSVSPSRDYQFQIGDFPSNQPVRMELTVFGFADAQRKQSAADPNPGNDTLNLWISRSCPQP